MAVKLRSKGSRGRVQGAGFRVQGSGTRGQGTRIGGLEVVASGQWAVVSNRGTGSGAQGLEVGAGGRLENASKRSPEPRTLNPELFLLLMLIGSLLLGGCAGYQVGTSTLYDPHIRTVYVPVFQSDSYRRNLGERLTEAVMKEIEAKTTYKVVGTPNADTTLRGRITNDTKRVAVENWYDDPRQLDVDLNVHVRWTDRHDNLIRQTASIPLPPELVAVSASAPLFPELGQSVATAQQQAIQRLAQQIVGMMEAPW